MDIFEFLRTSFRVVAAFLTPDILIYVGLVSIFLMALWSIISLICSYENRFTRKCNSIISYIKDNGITADNYPAFTKQWLGFPNIMRRAWKRYEVKREGIASDYLKQSECIDGILDGGINKQSRSLMKSAINLITITLALFSISIIATAQAGGGTITSLNNKVVVEALMIPLIILLLLKVNYYIYTATRHHMYRVAVDTFHDFVDLLDEQVDINSIFFGGEQSIALVSNIYENETLQVLRDKYQNKIKHKRNTNWGVVDTNNRGSGLNPKVNDVLSKKSSSTKNNNAKASNVIAEPDVKAMLNMSASKPKSNSKKDIITSQSEFVENMEAVEKLLEDAKKEKNPAKQKTINETINKKVSAMTAYKNKIKKQQLKSN